MPGFNKNYYDLLCVHSDKRQDSKSLVLSLTGMWPWRKDTTPTLSEDLGNDQEAMSPRLFLHRENQQSKLLNVRKDTRKISRLIFFEIIN